MYKPYMCVLSYKYKESTHFDFCLVKRVQWITVLRYASVTPLVLIIDSLFTTYHAPTAKKTLENQQEEMYDMFKTAMIRFDINKCFIQNNEIFGRHLFWGGVG